MVMETLARAAGIETSIRVVTATRKERIDWPPRLKLPHHPFPARANMPEIQRWFQSRLREIVNIAALRKADLSRYRKSFCRHAAPSPCDGRDCGALMNERGTGPLRDNYQAESEPLTLQPVPGLEDPGDGDHADRKKRQRHAEAQRDADVGNFVKAPAEAADQIDHRVEQRDGAPARGQHVDRIEAAAEESQRRHDQHRNHLQLFESVGPDADDEAEQAEGDRRQDQEREHQERMMNVQRHEQARGCENYQTEHDRFGGGCADIAEHDFEIGNRRRKDFIDGADKFRKIDAERGIGDALGQDRQHHEPRHDEGAVADAFDGGDPRADRGAEHYEIERGRHDRRDDALHDGPKGTRHFKLVYRADGSEIHGCRTSVPDSEVRLRSSHLPKRTSESKGTLANSSLWCGTELEVPS